MNTPSPKKYADGPAVEEVTGLNRRQVLTAAAVAAPAILLTTAVPAHATSAQSTLTVDIAASITSGDYSDVTVTVLDSQGNPWAGQSVTLSATGTTGIALDANSGVTNSAGVFTTRLTTTINTPVGDTLVVSATSGPLTTTDTATIVPVVLTVTPAPTAPHNNTIHVRAGEGNTITATLTYVSGRPIVGEGVSFEVSGFDATFGTYDPLAPVWVSTVAGTTDSNGAYAVTLTPETTLFGETATLTATSQTGPGARSAAVSDTLTATNTNAYAAGINTFGALGIGTTAAVSTLTETMRVFPARIKQIASGGYGGNSGAVTFFVLDDGSLWSVGQNADPLLGRPNSSDPTIIERVPLQDSVRSISVGNGRAFAITTSDEVYCWGTDAYGALGLGYGPTRTTPYKHPYLSDIKMIAVGGIATYVLTNSGTLKSFGYHGWRGRLGIGPSDGSGHGTPTDVVGITGIVASVHAFSDGGFALTEDGNLYTWGDGTVGQTGAGWYNSDAFGTPAQRLSDVKALAAGQSTGYAVTNSGAVVAWGSNDGSTPTGTFRGVLGNDAVTAHTATPTAISSLTSGVRSVFASSGTIYAHLDNGQIVAWGADTAGQFGNGSASGLSPSPVTAATTLPNDREVIGFAESNWANVQGLFVITQPVAE